MKSTGTPLSVEWTADGKHILLSRLKAVDEQMRFSLWGVPVNGEEQQKVCLVMTNFGNLSVHSDGKNLAFGSGRYPKTSGCLGDCELPDEGQFEIAIAGT